MVTKMGSVNALHMIRSVQNLDGHASVELVEKIIR